MSGSAATPAAARRGRPGHDRAAVRDAAVAAFTAQGYDATSMADIAARMGVTKSALYHHVGSKEELLAVALADAQDALDAELARARAADLTASDRLRTLVAGAVRVLIAHLPTVTLLLRVRGNTPVEQAALERRRAFDHAVTGLVRAAQRDGGVRDDVDAAVATRLIFGMVNSIVEWYRPGGAVDPDELARDVLAVALDGLQPR